jgi:hypothetical protein
MVSDCTECAAQIDERRAVQVQGRHGRTARGRAAFQMQEVRAPGKVARPLLAAWVEQGDDPASPGIECPRLGLFVAVARRAAQASSAAVLPAPCARGRTCSQTNGAQE